MGILKHITYSNQQGLQHNTIQLMLRKACFYFSGITLWVGTNEHISKVPLGHLWQGANVVPGLEKQIQYIKHQLPHAATCSSHYYCLFHKACINLHTTDSVQCSYVFNFYCSLIIYIYRSDCMDHIILNLYKYYKECKTFYVGITSSSPAVYKRLTVCLSYILPTDFQNNQQFQRNR